VVSDQIKPSHVNTGRIAITVRRTIEAILLRFRKEEKIDMVVRSRMNQDNKITCDTTEGSTEVGIVHKKIPALQAGIQFT